jgi:hypothetical protein
MAVSKYSRTHGVGRFTVQLFLTSTWTAKCSRTEEYFVNNPGHVSNNRLTPLTMPHRQYIRVILLADSEYRR